jgi:hypothetical protein
MCLVDVCRLAAICRLRHLSGLVARSLSKFLTDLDIDSLQQILRKMSVVEQTHRQNVRTSRLWASSDIAPRCLSCIYKAKEKERERAQPQGSRQPAIGSFCCSSVPADWKNRTGLPHVTRECIVVDLCAIAADMLMPVTMRLVSIPELRARY